MQKNRFKRMLLSQRRGLRNIGTASLQGNLNFLCSPKGFKKEEPPLITLSII